MRIRELASESSGTVLSMKGARIGGAEVDGGESVRMNGARALTVAHEPGKDEVSA
jgi:hypothetical protein